MAHYSIVKNLWDASPAFAVVQDDSEIHYLFAPGKKMPGLNDARIKRLVQASGLKAPTSPNKMVRLIITNAGQVAAEPAVEVASLDEAKAAALALL